MFCLFNITSKPDKIKKNIEDNVFNIFKLPIHYDGCKKKLNSSIIEDLELNKVIYPSVCNYPDTQICKSLIRVSSEYYTNNVPFLNDMQKMILSTCQQLLSDCFEETLSLLHIVLNVVIETKTLSS